MGQAALQRRPVGEGEAEQGVVAVEGDRGDRGRRAPGRDDDLFGSHQRAGPAPDAGAHRELAMILTADADLEADTGKRFAGYKRAAELLLYQANDPAAAAGPAGKACELAPEDHAAAMLYVDVLIGSGQTAEAGKVLEAAIAAQKKRSPELATMQQRMARVAGMLGDKDGQLNWLKKAFDVDRKNGEIAYELAQAATEAGDYELALKPLRAISLMENPQPITRPMALLWEAKIEHARGNRAKAELWAKRLRLRRRTSTSDWIAASIALSSSSLA